VDGALDVLAVAARTSASAPLLATAGASAPLVGLLQVREGTREPWKGRQAGMEEDGAGRGGETGRLSRVGLNSVAARALGRLSQSGERWTIGMA